MTTHAAIMANWIHSCLEGMRKGRGERRFFLLFIFILIFILFNFIFILLVYCFTLFYSILYHDLF